MKNRRNAIGNKGFSLVEVVSIIAILSIVIIGIGSIMVYSTKTYQRGNEETKIQQEAQFAANRIDGMIQNSTLVEYNSNILTMNDGTSVHTVLFEPASEQLLYEKDASGQQLLAENIKDFNVDTTKFASARVVKLDMTVRDNDREIKMDYTMKARNEGAAAIAALPDSATIQAQNVILVPGQSYPLSVNVLNSTAGFTANATDSELKINTVTSNSVAMELTTNAKGDASFGNIYLNLATNELVPGTALPKAQKQVVVAVRRVRTVGVSHSAPVPAEQPRAVGTKYTFKGVVNCTNPDKEVGATWDDNHKNPYSVEWTAQLKIGGSNVNVSQYLNVANTKDNDKEQTITYEIIQEIPAGSELTVTGKSKHANGVNKANKVYADIFAKDTITFDDPALPAGSDVETVMEPSEKKQIALAMAGASIKCDLTGNSSSSTKANYSSNKVSIELSKDEKGTSGSFGVKVYPDGDDTNASNIAVNVRRVDSVEFTSDAAKNLKDNNKQNGVIILEAFADGTHLDKKASDDDDYVNPYYLSWSVVTKEGVEKKLDEYTDYIKKATVTDNESGNQSVKIELKKELPNGTIIKATSKHAAGENKTLLKYDDVYAEIEVKGGSSQPQYAKAPFERGEDYLFNKNTGDLKQYVKKEIEPKYFMRIHDHKTGEKTAYLKSGEDGNQMKIGLKESGALLPDRGYTIEYILVVADMDKKILYYPKDEAIRETGSGFDEFTYVDTGLSDSYEYRWFYDLDKAIPVFDMGDGKYVSNKGSKDSPIEIKDKSTVTIDDVVGINVGRTNSNPDANGYEFKNNVYPKLFQKWENGTWVTIEDVTIAMEKSGSSKMLNNQNNPYNWYMGQRDNRIFHFRVDNNKTKTPGIYRVGVGIKNGPTRFSKISGKLWDKTTTEITEDLEWSLYDEANDTGFIYIEIK